MRVKMQQHAGSIASLEARDARSLGNLLCTMIAFMVKCDLQRLEIPEKFVTQFGVIRSVLMRKCVKDDYTELQFREFFSGMLKFAGEEHGATPERIASLEAMNQLVQ